MHRLTWVIGIAALLVVLVVASTAGRRTIMCDGLVPAWVDPDHQATGCVEMPPVWEYLYPWHWGAEDTCLTVCLQPSPFRS